MLTFFLYLMKSVLCLALFYPFYMVLLSRETFHRFNRMALISILVASVVIPACRITTEEPLLLTQLYQRWENWLTGQDTETVAVAYVDWAEMEMTAMPITEEEISKEKKVTKINTVDVVYEDKDYLKECEKNAVVSMKENFEIKKVTDMTIKIYSDIVKGK